jgi:FkbM family methyltransferase
MNKFILFDVGANQGQDSLSRTANNPNVEAWAFEPMPEYYQKINETAQNFQDRYHIYPLAMSDYDGESTFYVATSEVGFGNGANSLYPFVDHLNETWPGRISTLNSRRCS